MEDSASVTRDITIGNGRRLPVELYRHVIEQLPPLELYPLLSTSHEVRLEAAPQYFRTVDLDGRSQQSLSRFARICPGVGHWVKALSIDHIPISSPDIFNLFESLPDLISLELHWDQPRSSNRDFPPFDRFVPTPPRFHLQKLKLEYHFCDSLVAFLRSQRLTLWSLEIGIVGSSPPPVDITFPNLRVFGGDWYLICPPIFRQGTLKCLSELITGLWMHDKEFTDPLASVTVLRDWELMWSLHEGLESWRLPNVRFMQCYTVGSGDAARLSQLPTLLTVERIQLEYLNPLHVDFASQAAGLFTRFPKLSVVDFFHGHTGGCWIFKRGQEGVWYPVEPEGRREEWINYLDDDYRSED